MMWIKSKTIDMINSLYIPKWPSVDTEVNSLTQFHLKGFFTQN